MKKSILLITIIFLFLTSPLLAFELKDIEAPPELKKWENWILYDNKDILCPKSNSQSLCVWPQYLKLNLNNSGGTFEIAWQNLSDENYLTLPGELNNWPLNLKDEDGNRYPIIGSNSPTVKLNKGKYVLHGEFSWLEIPETLDIPKEFKIVELNLNNKHIPFPILKANSNSNTLWLKENNITQNKQVSEDDYLNVSVNRLIIDSNPMIVNTRVKIFVSGKAREELIKDILLPNTIPSSLTGPLPAQISKDGLRLQLQPGVWEFFIEARLNKNTDIIGPSISNFSTEYWAFIPVPSLRQVEISGSRQIDSSQIDFYTPWQNYTIYEIKKDDSLTFNTIRRGDPEPKPNQLNLLRQCWLDYDGKGLSCYDQLSGIINKQWHLNTGQSFNLEHIKLHGVDQVITQQEGSDGTLKPGIQIRNQNINLEADLRIDEFNNILPASGWDQNIKNTTQSINLPPGYKLLHINGAKALNHKGQEDAWVSQWQVLDIFLILIISITVLKLFGIPWGILSFITMCLIFYEYASPKTVILHLLATTALLKVIYSKKAIYIIRIWRSIAILILIITSTLFFLNQAKTALYPQLENPNYVSSGIIPTLFKNQNYNNTSYREPQASALERSLEVISPELAPVEELHLAMESEQYLDADIKKMKNFDITGSSALTETINTSGSIKQKANQITQRPESKVQHGSGRPNWSWRTIYFTFTGEINKDQEIKLYFLTPKITFILNILRIILTATFIMLLLSLIKKQKPKEKSNKIKTVSQTAILIFAFIFIPFTGKAIANETNSFPPQYLLNEYKDKLLKEDTTVNISIPNVNIEIVENKVLFTFEAEAEDMAIYSLPIIDSDFFKSTKIYLEDGRNLNLLANNYGELLTIIPKGINTFYYEGIIKTNSPFQINFPLNQQGIYKPKKISFINSGNWSIEGLEKNGLLLNNSLYINPQIDEKEEKEIEELEKETILEPFYTVERALVLGINWQVYTTVTRTKSLGQPSTVKVSLLEAEKPLTRGLKPVNGELTINFSANANTFTWESNLNDLNIESKDQIEMNLTANNNNYKEIWRVDASPIWAVKFENLVPVSRVNSGTWQPTWDPWLGENLKLIIKNPKPIPGQYLTIDKAKLEMEVKEQSTLNTLTFNIRASQGGAFKFPLPIGSEIQSVKINDSDVPNISNNKQDKEIAPEINLFLNPGEQNIEVKWVINEQINTMVKTPQLNLNTPIANLNLEINLPHDRWLIFTGGPQQGPAVLLWPLLIVLAVLAYIFSKTKLTPLNFFSWFLLIIGLASIHLFASILIIVWFFVVGLRNKKETIKNQFLFNASQIGLGIWTFLSCIIIYQCIKASLTNLPTMFLSGNDSYSGALYWFQDRIINIWPEAWVLSMPKKVYQYIMLAWALWLAFSLISWVKWFWQSFCKENIWKKKSIIENN